MKIDRKNVITSRLFSSVLVLPTNLVIDASEYDELGECYLMVSWIDWETEEDFELRMYEKEWAKERAVNSLKQLITRNPQEAVEIIKELKLI